MNVDTVVWGVGVNTKLLLGVLPRSIAGCGKKNLPGVNDSVETTGGVDIRLAVRISVRVMLSHRTSSHTSSVAHDGGGVAHQGLLPSHVSVDSHKCTSVNSGDISAVMSHLVSAGYASADMYGARPPACSGR